MERGGAAASDENARLLCSAESEPAHELNIGKQSIDDQEAIRTFGPQGSDSSHTPHFASMV